MCSCLRIDVLFGARFHRNKSELVFVSGAKSTHLLPQCRPPLWPIHAPRLIIFTEGLLGLVVVLKPGKANDERYKTYNGKQQCSKNVTCSTVLNLVPGFHVHQMQPRLILDPLNK